MNSALWITLSIVVAFLGGVWVSLYNKPRSVVSIVTILTSAFGSIIIVKQSPVVSTAHVQWVILMLWIMIWMIFFGWGVLSSKTRSVSTQTGEGDG